MWPYTYLNSPFVSDKYEWFCDLGYPQCDLHVREDGSWAILEMLNAPLVPSLTAWRWIATGFKNVEPCQSRIKRILESIDPTRKEIWQREEQKTAELEANDKAREEHADAVATEWTSSIIRNPALMERVAKNGMHEILPHKIAENIAESKIKEA